MDTDKNTRIFLKILLDRYTDENPDDLVHEDKIEAEKINVYLNEWLEEWLEADMEKEHKELKEEFMKQAKWNKNLLRSEFGWLFVQFAPKYKTIDKDRKD